MNHLKTGLAAVLISAGALTLTACGSTAIPDTSMYRMWKIM